MKRLLFIAILVFFAAITVGCTTDKPYHKTALPDPESFNAHFGDIDADGDDLVNRDEFNAYFKNPEPEVFNALDMNQDGHVDHDEWHKFKEAHGMRQHE